MRWQDKIGKRAVKHLREMGITTLEGMKRNAAHQKKQRERPDRQHLPAGILEPCFDCKDIARKLDLPI